MKNRSRYSPFLRIVGFTGLLLGAQMLAGVIVIALHCGSAIMQGMTFAQADAAMLDAITAYQTELLLISYAIILLVLLLLARKNRKGLLEYTSLHLPSNFKLVLLAAVLGLAASFWTSMAVGLFPWPDAWVGEYSEAASSLVTASPVMDFIATVLIGPIIEEILFRGLIYEAFCAMVPAGAAAIFQAILFGGVHSSPIWMIYAGAVGCVLGYVRKRTGSLRPCIAMHIAFNGTSYIFSWFAEHYGDNSGAIVLSFVGSAALMIWMLSQISRASTPDKPDKADASDSEDSPNPPDKE